MKYIYLFTSQDEINVHVIFIPKILFFLFIIYKFEAKQIFLQYDITHDVIFIMMLHNVPACKQLSCPP